MPPSRTAKGKKRAHDDVSDEDLQPVASTSAVSLDTVGIVKKSKRAVTRRCPVCDEEIPVRLLGRHADLEAERLDEIVAAIGSVEVLDIAEPDDGHTARTRKSAVKARMNMQPNSRFKSVHSDTATLELIDKSLRLIKRHRKDRQQKLREMTHHDDDSSGLSGFHRGRGRWAGTGEGTLCPVCMKIVPGDLDVVEAHVDACVRHESRMQEAREHVERQRQQTEGVWDVDVEGEVHMRVTDGANLQGMGFTVRDDSQDVEDEVDVEAEDEAVYGAAQFTEHDVLHLSMDAENEDEAVDVDDDSAHTPWTSRSEHTRPESRTIEELVAEERLVKKIAVAGGSSDKRSMDEMMGVSEIEELDRIVERARTSGGSRALIDALQNKVQMLESTRISSATSLLCRICLDPYTEPTVSTGCWHTCCRECWLRCLGSTKLCPICKRITATGDLRRIYL